MSQRHTQIRAIFGDSLRDRLAFLSVPLTLGALVLPIRFAHADCSENVYCTSKKQKLCTYDPGQYFGLTGQNCPPNQSPFYCIGINQDCPGNPNNQGSASGQTPPGGSLQLTMPTGVGPSASPGGQAALPSPGQLTLGSTPPAPAPAAPAAAGAPATGTPQLAPTAGVTPLAPGKDGNYISKVDTNNDGVIDDKDRAIFQEGGNGGNLVMCSQSGTNGPCQNPDPLIDSNTRQPITDPSALSGGTILGMNGKPLSPSDLPAGSGGTGGGGGGNGGGGLAGGGGANPPVNQDGNTQTDQNSINQAQQDKRDGYQNSNEATTKAGNADNCDTSAKIDGGYGCSGTRAMIESAKVTNVLAQTTGSVATAALGQSAAMQASEQGTQSAAMMGAATTQRTSGDIQVAAGTTNVLMGAVQLYQSLDHSSNVGKINAVTTDAKLSMDGYNGKTMTGTTQTDSGLVISTNAVEGNGTSAGNGYMSAQGANGTQTDKVMRDFHLQDGDIKTTVALGSKQCKDSFQQPAQQALLQSCLQRAAAQTAARSSEMSQKYTKTRNLLNDVGQNADNEQKKVAADAMAGAMTSMMTGAGQVVSGGFNIAAANQLEDAAKAMAGIENAAAAPGFQPLGAGSLQPGGAMAPGNAQALNPSGVRTEQCARDGRCQQQSGSGQPRPTRGRGSTQYARCGSDGRRI